MLLLLKKGAELCQLQLDIRMQNLLGKLDVKMGEGDTGRMRCCCC